MQVFKLYMKILKSKLPTLMIYFVLFTILCIASTVGSSTEEKFEDSKLDICVTDLDNTPESKALTDYIAKKHNIVEPKMDIKDALYYMSVDYSLTIKEGYAEKLASGDAEDIFEGEYVHESYSVAYMGSFLDEYVSCVRACAAGGEDMSEAVKSAEEALGTETNVTVVADGSGASANQENGVNYFRYLAYILISIMINALAPVIISMKSKEVRFRTNCSTTSPLSFVTQVIMGSMVFVALVCLIFIILGIPLGGGMYEGRGWLKVLNCILFAMISVLIAVLCSLMMTSTKSIPIICNVIGLGMGFLCGMFVPQTLLSESVLSTAKFLPAFWYIKLVDMLAGVTPYSSSAAVQCLLIQAGFAAAIAALAVLIYKLKLQSNE